VWREEERGRERNYVWMDYCTICASYLINDSNWWVQVGPIHLLVQAIRILAPYRVISSLPFQMISIVLLQSIFYKKSWLMSRISKTLVKEQNMVKIIWNL
jgi:hypothetical protein